MRYIAILSLLLLISGGAYAQDLTESEEAAISQRPLTTAEAEKRQENCALDFTGEPTEPFKGRPAVMSTADLPAFLLAIGYDLASAPGKADARIWKFPDLPNGGIGGKDLCGQAVVFTPGEDHAYGRTSMFLALRLAGSVLLYKDYPNALGQALLRGQFFTIRSESLLLVDVAGLRDEEVLEMVSDLSFIWIGDFPVRIGNTLAIPADQLRIDSSQ